MVTDEDGQFNCVIKINLNIKANVLLNKHNSTDNVMSIEWFLIDSLIV